MLGMLGYVILYIPTQKWLELFANWRSWSDGAFSNNYLGLTITLLGVSRLQSVKHLAFESIIPDF